jgi:putative ABC transport system permease protein
MKEALRNIWRRKVRAALTIFGVAIGIFAFTTMGALSAYFNDSIDHTLAYYSSRVTITSKASGSSNEALFASGGQLPQELVTRVKLIEGVERTYPTITIPADTNASSSGFGPGEQIFGYNPSDLANDSKKLKVATGRDLKEGDFGKVVVGSNLVQSKHLKLGNNVTLYGKQFEVVGILEHTNGATDTFYEITLPEAQDIVRSTNLFNANAGSLVTNIVAIPKPGTDPDKLAKMIDAKISGVHAIPPNQFREQIESASAIFNKIILGSALIAVVVGSLSVINTMIMSVAERRKEIGIKRVAGAKTRHILREILLETGVMGLIGGIIGFALGVLVITLINRATAESGIQIFSVTPRLAALSIGGAAVLGFVAGLYPAWRASRVRPIEVLRGE